MTEAVPNRSDIVVRVLDVKRYYGEGENATKALDGISLDIHRGEYLSIMGPSGSGKTTLFNMIGGIDSPTEGIDPEQQEVGAIRFGLGDGALNEGRQSHLDGAVDRDLDDPGTSGGRQVIGQEAAFRQYQGQEGEQEHQEDPRGSAWTVFHLSSHFNSLSPLDSARTCAIVQSALGP